MFPLEYNFDSKAKRLSEAEKINILFEACSRQSDCGECQG